MKKYLKKGLKKGLQKANKVFLPGTPISPSPARVGSPTAAPAPPAIQTEDPPNVVETGWNGFKIALGILRDVSVVFPPLQAAVGGLLTIISAADQVSANQESFDSMAQRIRLIAAVLKKYETLGTIPEHIQATTDALTQSIERRKVFINMRMNRSLVGRVLNASEDASDIVDSLQELSFAVELFQVDASFTTAIQAQKALEVMEDTREQVEDIRERELLKILDAARGASFEESPCTGCLDGTRIDTLSKLFAWAANPASHPIFWMSGMAGIGKSAIAHSFCQRMAKAGQLGASFFCARQSEVLSNVSLILPTLAYQLVFKSQAYRAGLVKVLGQTSLSSYALATLQKQAQDLFINLKDQLKIDGCLIIIIDALDECTRPTDVSDLLRVLLRSELPIRFLITSRPELHIGQGFSVQEQFEIDTMLVKSGSFLSVLLNHASLRLHDAEHDVVEQDITRYLASKLSPILERVDKGDAPNMLDALVKKSGNLFIFAFTAVQYILGARQSMTNTQQRFSAILGSSEVPYSLLSMQLIDGLYQQIFESAYQSKELSEIRDLRASLDMLLCLRRPQSISVISMLLDSHTGDVRAHLEDFSSVLNIPDSDEEPVFVFHASFPDYVLDARRSGLYTVMDHDQHLHLVVACLELMNRNLHKNMCGIEKRHTLNSDVSESVIHLQISAALKYACIYWASHLEAGADTNSQKLIQLLKDFVDIHLLHWLECLSLIGELGVAFNCIQKAHQFIAQHGLRLKKAQDILLDMQYMIPQVYYFVKLHALEVYVSALIWLPTKSKLRMQYIQEQSYQIIMGLEQHWSTSLQVLYTVSAVRSIAVSSNGAHVACASGTKVQIWSLETSECIKELQSHTDWVTSVAFSPDGSKLASGSQDKTVQIWNADTGEVIHMLIGHTLWVISVAFSPDGSKLASGSRDETIQIWNANTGTVIHTLVGHTGWVNSVVFSPNGSMLASGSGDKTVQIWNANTGEALHNLMGHTHWVTSVVFSPDGSRVASGSGDKTVKIWNANTGEATHTLIGHTDWVTSVDFSPDGSMLASGSQDETVQIWNANTGRVLYNLVGHIHWVNSVAFLSNGSRVASGSGDKTVQIWNANTEEAIQSLRGHTNFVNSVAFSPDGFQLASGLDDGTMQVWNANTGEVIHKLRGHTDSINSVAFSPDGSMLASGSQDETVLIWNANAGEVIHKLIGHTDWVDSVVFSPDGSRLVSGSGDNTMQIWDAYSGEAICTLIGHTDWINSMAFSSDGSKLASGSQDETVQIWDANTGEITYSLIGHTHWVTSVAFSSDRSMLASGSGDNTVQIWNADTGELIYRLISHTGLVNSVAFLPDGSKLVSESANETVQIWNAHTGDLLYTLPKHSNPSFYLPKINSLTTEFRLRTIYQPVPGQYTIAQHSAQFEMQSLLWIWGSKIQPKQITVVTYMHEKICLVYGNGVMVVVKLSIE